MNTLASRPRGNLAQRHRGAVLLVAIILLMIMAMMAVSATDMLTMQSQLVAHQDNAQTLHHLTGNELQAQFERMQDPAWRNRIDSSGPTASALAFRQLATADFLTAIDPLRYQRSGSIALTRVSELPVSGYSLGRFLLRQYEISITTQSVSHQQSSHQALGVAYIEIAN